MATKLDINDITELNFEIDVSAQNSVPGPVESARLVITQGDISMTFPARVAGKNATVPVPALARFMDIGSAQAVLEVEVSKRVFRPLEFQLDIDEVAVVEAKPQIDLPSPTPVEPQKEARQGQEMMSAGVPKVPTGLSHNEVIARAQVLGNIKKLRR